MSNDYNGCSDPDYYDIEFREQNPEVYGDDDLMQSYRGFRRHKRQCQNRPNRPTADDERLHREYQEWKRQNPDRVALFKSFDESKKQKDAEFHKEYEQWRRNHSDKIEFFKTPSIQSSKNQIINDHTPIWPYIIIGVFVWSFVILVLVQACD